MEALNARSIRVKVFVSDKPELLEELVNKWLATQPPATLVLETKFQSSAATAKNYAHNTKPEWMHSVLVTYRPPAS